MRIRNTARINAVSDGNEVRAAPRKKNAEGFHACSEDIIIHHGDTEARRKTGNAKDPKIERVVSTETAKTVASPVGTKRSRKAGFSLCFRASLVNHRQLYDSFRSPCSISPPV